MFDDDVGWLAVVKFVQTADEDGQLGKRSILREPKCVRILPVKHRDAIGMRCGSVSVGHGLIQCDEVVAMRDHMEPVAALMALRTPAALWTMQPPLRVRDSGGPVGSPASENTQHGTLDGEADG